MGSGIRVRVRVSSARTGRPMGADVAPCTGTPKTTVGTAAAPGSGGGGGGGSGGTADATRPVHGPVPMARSMAWA